jgi:hypothetical protein
VQRAVSAERSKMRHVGLIAMPKFEWRFVGGEDRMQDTIFNVYGDLDGKRPEPVA